jgi:hypothetical protein
MKIDTPGIYEITNADYHADPCPSPSLSSSLAKIMIARSPRHAWMKHPKLNPDFSPDECEQFDNGSAAHDYLLCGGENIIVVNADDYRTKAAQSARDEARADGKIPVLGKQFERIEAMGIVARTALATNEDLGIDLANGEAEKSFIWEEDGVWLRSRPDWFSQSLGLEIDYKTTGKSANPSGMARHAVSSGWDIQSALCLRGFKRFYHHNNPRFIFMVQENEPPYAVCFVGMGGTMLAMGEDKVEHAIRDWRMCLKRADEWPGYPTKIVYPDPPAFALMEWEESDLCRP